MTRRLLPREEWSKLDGTGLDVLIPGFPPEACVLVVETDEGDIAAVCSFFPMWHLEGTYIAPAFRKHHGVVRQLLDGMRATAKRLGVERLLTAADDDDMRGFLARLHAEPLPGTHYVWPIGKDS